MKEVFQTASPEETMDLGARLARDLRRGDVIGLTGELGAGKTCLVQGICRGCGVTETVTSPTFILLNRYAGRDSAGAELLLYHFDMYRIRSAAEMYDLGYEEYFRGDGICLVEWAGTLGGLLPAEAVAIHLTLGESEQERIIEVDRGGTIA